MFFVVILKSKVKQKMFFVPILTFKVGQKMFFVANFVGGFSKNIL
jgi:hypothetical protein